MGMNRDMMARLQQMQETALKAQADLQAQVVEGTSGGGAVKIEVTGGLNVESLKIDPEVVDADDIEMLEDLVIAALNEYGLPADAGGAQKEIHRLEKELVGLNDTLNTMRDDLILWSGVEEEQQWLRDYLSS